jgi:hypothetical protein
MDSISYIIVTVALNLIGLISFFFMHVNYRKRQEIKFTAVVRRIMNVRTKDEFEQIFRRLATNEIKTLSGKQKNELLSLADTLTNNLI